MFSYCTIFVPLWLGIIVFSVHRRLCAELLLPPTSFPFYSFTIPLSVCLYLSFFFSFCVSLFVCLLAPSFTFENFDRRSFFTVLHPPKAPFRFNDDVVGKVKGRPCFFVILFCPGPSFVSLNCSFASLVYVIVELLILRYFPCNSLIIILSDTNKSCGCSLYARMAKVRRT